MDITQVAVAVIGLCIAIITAVVIPWIRSKTSANKMAEISQWVEAAVNAAEQLSKTGVIDKDSRYQYVQDFLAEKGYLLNYDECQVLIESFVHELPKILAGEASESSVETSDTSEQ